MDTKYGYNCLSIWILFAVIFTFAMARLANFIGELRDGKHHKNV